jgi:hypothetical protein
MIARFLIIWRFSLQRLLWPTPAIRVRTALSFSPPCSHWAASIVIMTCLILAWPATHSASAQQGSSKTDLIPDPYYLINEVYALDVEPYPNTKLRRIATFLPTYTLIFKETSPLRIEIDKQQYTTVF